MVNKHGGDGGLRCGVEGQGPPPADLVYAFRLKFSFNAEVLNTFPSEIKDDSYLWASGSGPLKALLWCELRPSLLARSHGGPLQQEERRRGSLWSGPPTLSGFQHGNVISSQFFFKCGRHLGQKLDSEAAEALRFWQLRSRFRWKSWSSSNISFSSSVYSNLPVSTIYLVDAHYLCGNVRSYLTLII